MKLSVMQLFSIIRSLMRETIAAALLFISVVSFAVAEDISAIAARYPELKVPQPGGLPIRVAREDWPNAQRLLSQDAGWREWVNSRKADLDAWMSTFNDRPELISGHQFELLDRKSQAPVQWSPKMPEPGDGDERATTFKRAWVAYVRSHNFDQILEAARIYRLTGDNRYSEWAARQLDFYARNYNKWPLQSRFGKARMMGQTLDEATASVQLVEASRLLEQAVPPERLALWRTGLFMPMIDNWRGFNQGLTNINLWVMVAKALIGYRFNDAKLISEAIDGPMGIRVLFSRSVTADFLWYEGSFSYNDYVLMALKPFFVQASLMGYADSLKREMLIAQNMLLAPLMFRFPDGKRPTPGDDRGARSPALYVGLHALLRRVLPTSAGLLESARHKNWDSLIDPVKIDPSLTVKLPPVITADYEAERMAVLKTAGWQLFMHYGQLAANHAQQEALNYEFYRNTTPVSLDQGTVAYFSQLHSKYFSLGAAHNVPLVNGAGQEHWAPGKVTYFNAEEPAIEVTQPDYWKNGSASRRLEIRDDRISDKVVIKMRDDSKDRYRLGLLFNSECKIDLDDATLGSPSPSSAPAGPGFEYWTDVFRRAAPARWSARLACGSIRMRLSVNASVPHALFYGSAPATPLPARRQAIYLELLGREANFDMQFTAESELKVKP
jgi:hypothetical protein